MPQPNLQFSAIAVGSGDECIMPKTHGEKLQGFLVEKQVRL
ncbi:MAG: hypothetical protein V7K15_03545 [Nostoc sp.]